MRTDHDEDRDLPEFIDAQEAQCDSQSEATKSRRQLIKAGSVLSSLAAFSALTGKAQTITVPGPKQETDAGSFLAGQTAIVTGAARGIGQAIALTLAKAGANIVAVDIARNLPYLQYPLSTYQQLVWTTSQIQALGVKALAVPADVRDGAQMQDVVEQALGTFERIDVVVANAGVQIYNVALVDTNEDQWRLIIDVNLTGAANSIRAALPTMVKQKSGSIIGLTS